MFMFTMYATYPVEENEIFLKMDWSTSYLMTWCYLICRICTSGWRQRKMRCVPFMLFLKKSLLLKWLILYIILEKYTKKLWTKISGVMNLFTKLEYIICISFSLMSANKLKGTAVQLDHLLGGGGKRKIKSPFRSDLFLTTSANPRSW